MLLILRPNLPLQPRKHSRLCKEVMLQWPYYAPTIHNNSKFSNHGTTKRHDPHIKTHKNNLKTWRSSAHVARSPAPPWRPSCIWQSMLMRSETWENWSQDWYTGGNHHKTLIAGRIIPILIPNHPLYLFYNTYIICVATSLDDVATCFLFLVSCCIPCHRTV